MAATEKRVCPICGQTYCVSMKHWRKFHSEGMTWDEFKARELGLPEVPKCKVCGEPLHVYRDGFQEVCDNRECQSSYFPQGKPHSRIKVCPLCGRDYRDSKTHWRKFHKDEVSYIYFKAREMGYEDTPKCVICGVDAYWDAKRPGFHDTCGSPECVKEYQYQCVVHMANTNVSARVEKYRQKGFPQLVKAREIGRRIQKENNEPSMRKIMLKKLQKRLGENAPSSVYIIGYWDPDISEYFFKVGFTTKLMERRWRFIKESNLRERKVLVINGPLTEMFMLEFGFHTNPEFREYQVLNPKIIKGNGAPELYSPDCFKQAKEYFTSLGYDLEEYPVIKEG